MATVDSRTLDAAERLLFFHVNAAGVPVPLPFDLVTIDADFQAYEPISGGRITAETRQRQRGKIAGATYLKRNEPLPRPAPGTPNPDAFPVWAYYGV